MEVSTTNRSRLQVIRRLSTQEATLEGSTARENITWGKELLHGACTLKEMRVHVVALQLTPSCVAALPAEQNTAARLELR